MGMHSYLPVDYYTPWVHTFSWMTLSGGSQATMDLLALPQKTWHTRWVCWPGDPPSAAREKMGAPVGDSRTPSLALVWGLQMSPLCLGACAGRAHSLVTCPLTALCQL